MTGRLSSGNTSILVRRKARTQPPAMAATATMMVKGCRKAKTMGFMLHPQILPRRRLRRGAGGNDPPTTLAPVLGGEGLGERGLDPCWMRSLPQPLSPEHRGEGA